MKTDDRTDLLNFLSESAFETTVLARGANPERFVALVAEAEELAALRSRIMARAAQFELPLETLRAA